MTEHNLIQAPKLYNRDSNGNIRQWWMEYDHEKFRSVSGVVGGAEVVAGFKYPVAKNVGRSNEMSVEEQVKFIVSSTYTKRTHKGEYTQDIDKVDECVKPFFQPMLAGGYNPKKHKAEDGWYLQPKLDGIRCVIREDGAWSRGAKPFYTVGHIQAALEIAMETYPGLVVDGELYNHSLKEDFEQIVSLVRKQKPNGEQLQKCRELLQFHIYDCYLSEDDTTEERMLLLDKLFEGFSNYKFLIRVPTLFTKSQEKMDEHYEQCMDDGYEGQMGRPAGGLYDDEESRNVLFKRKDMFDGEFPIVGIHAGVGKWAGKCKSVEILLPNGSTQRSGVKGNEAFLKKILEDAESLIGTLVTVNYQNPTKAGKLRFPVVEKFWRTKERTM